MKRKFAILLAMCAVALGVSAPAAFAAPAVQGTCIFAHGNGYFEPYAYVYGASWGIWRVHSYSPYGRQYDYYSPWYSMGKYSVHGWTASGYWPYNQAIESQYGFGNAYGSVYGKLGWNNPWHAGTPCG